jgi:hypothetical protein
MNDDTLKIDLLKHQNKMLRNMIAENRQVSFARELIEKNSREIHFILLKNFVCDAIKH